MALFKSKSKKNEKLNLDKLPNHLAIIMDGNGRWAKRRGLPRNLGHKAGCENIRKITNSVRTLGVNFLTYYAFSTENWKRPKDEVDGIFNLIRQYIKSDSDDFLKNNVKIVSIGDISKIPNDLYEELCKIKEKTKNCTGLTLCFAINYGGRDEILRAVNKAIENGKPLLNVDEFSGLLDTAFIPDPDFVIRTSGEMRLSNFLMYQMAYSELFFTKTYWPDFSERELIESLIDFQARHRRFGGLEKWLKEINWCWTIIILIRQIIKQDYYHQ